MLNKIKTLMVFAAIMVFCFGFSAFAEDEISIIIDGVKLEAKDANGQPVYPIAVDGTTYLPVRAIGEAFDLDVSWEGSTNTVYIGTGAGTESYTEELKVVVDGVRIDPTDQNGKPVPPFAYNGTTYIPVRAVGEAFNKSVQWDGASYSVIITSPPELTYYTDFDKIPDFGAYFDMNFEPSMSSKDMYLYRGNAHERLEEYIELLVSLGFVKVDEMVTSETMSYAYEKDGQIAVVASMDMGVENILGISLISSNLSYKGELRFYDQYPAVPDYGALNLAELVEATEMAENMTAYIYEGGRGTEQANELTMYCQALEENGFYLFYRDMGWAMYVNRASENTVIIQMIVDGERELMSVTVEQWPN